MQLSKFNVICLTDAQYGISASGIPVKIVDSWTKYFKNMTVGKKSHSNAVIMGRKTFELFGLLENRYNFVISKTLNQSECTDVIIYNSLLKCLSGIKNSQKEYDEVFVIGGESLFKEALTKFSYLCKNVYLGVLLNEVFDCDQFFPYQRVKHLTPVETVKLSNYTRYIYSPSVNHQEDSYVKLLTSILDSGDRVKDGLTLYNQNLQLDVSSEFPIITTREVNLKKVIDDFVDDIRNRDFNCDGVGFRMRTVESYSIAKSYEGEDQLQQAFENLYKSNPAFVTFERIGTNFPVINARFYLSTNKKYLNATIFFGELDAFSQYPYFSTYFSLLVISLAHLLTVTPKNIYMSFMAISINDKYIDYVKNQIKTSPHPLPGMTLKNSLQIRSFADFERTSFELFGDYTFARKFIVDKSFV